MSGAPSRLGLGCGRMGSFNNRAPVAQQWATLEVALDLGVTMFDTADVYGQGDSERMLGRALRRRRDEAFVVTKFGKRFSPAMRLMRPVKPLLRPLLARAGAGQRVTARRGAHLRLDFRADAAAPALDASLRRLRFDHVDGVLLHSPAPDDLADPALAPALEALRRAGKTRAWGVSGDTAAVVRAALALPGLGLLQLPLDLLDDPALAAPLAAARAGGVRLFVREAIRLQPDLPPAQAVARAAARAPADCVLVGASAPERLAALVRAVDARPC